MHAVRVARVAAGCRSWQLTCAVAKHATFRAAALPLPLLLPAAVLLRPPWLLQACSSCLLRLAGAQERVEWAETA